MRNREKLTLRQLGPQEILDRSEEVLTAILGRNIQKLCNKLVRTIRVQSLPYAIWEIGNKKLSGETSGTEVVLGKPRALRRRIVTYFFSRRVYLCARYSGLVILCLKARTSFKTYASCSVCVMEYQE